MPLPNAFGHCSLCSSHRRVQWLQLYHVCRKIERNLKRIRFASPSENKTNKWVNFPSDAILVDSLGILYLEVWGAWCDAALRWPTSGYRLDCSLSREAIKLFAQIEVAWGELGDNKIPMNGDQEAA